MKIFFLKNNGFTLTELLVVIAAITIMSGVSLVFVSQYSPTYKLKGDASQIAIDIRKTQNFALTDQSTYKIKFSKGGKNYSIFKKIDESNETLIENINLTSGISFVNDDLVIAFNSSGAPNIGADITIINSKSEQKTVSVTQIGFVKIM